MIGVSKNYLWKLESAQKPLGEELALRIQKETAISAAWLLWAASRQPIDDMGDPYSHTTCDPGAHDWVPDFPNADDFRMWLGSGG
jgi:hypothetical protein